MPKIIQGYAALYDTKHYYWKNERFETFERSCFAGSLSGLFLAREHKYTDRWIADMDKGTLEILDTDIGLAFRAKLSPGDLEYIGDRSEVSVGYVSRSTEDRNGVHVIKSATLLEISLCSVATIRSTHAIICDSDSVGTLAESVASSFATDAAGQKFMDALRRLQS